MDSMHRLREFVKREGWFILAVEGRPLRLYFERSNSLYLLIPREINEMLKRYGVDLRRDRDILVRCELIEDSRSGKVSLVYSFWQTPQTPGRGVEVSQAG
jgi:hypothetical protein